MTGLLIRDFSKQYRELRYSDSGSIEFSEIEHNAYRLSLTLEITHLDGVRYSNLKTLPENTHYGYCTLFRGSTVTENIPIKFPKFRIFDIINQGIWNYHQATENVQVIDSLMGGYGLYYHSAHLALAESESPVGSLVRGVGRLAIPDGQGEGERLYWESQVEELTEEFDGDDGYRAYPIATPFPDLAKFKGDLRCSFLWRLEAWYLVNPLVYVLDNPTDTGDDTEDESEYPEPDEGDGDGDGDSFPPSSPIPASRDPRDFTGGNELQRLNYRLVLSGRAVGAQGTLVSYGPNDLGLFALFPSQLPLSADASDSITPNRPGGVNTYFGVVVKDRLGATITVFASGVSFTKGDQNLTVTLVQ